MNGQIKMLAIAAVVGLVGYFFLFGDKTEQTADLGQVLDRTEYALAQYQGHIEGQNITEVSEENYAEFTSYFAEVLNSEPRFYDDTLGLEMQKDASFLGFADTNTNGVQDEGEGKVFTVEIDSENNRLIATDVAGNHTGMRFSGTGFLAGALLGNMLGRQRGAGVAAGSFNNRNVTSRSAYRAPSSARGRARSGGLRAGK